MPTCSANRLRELTAGLFEAVGTPTDTSAFIANSLVAANLAGHDSHGVIRILQYIEVVESGALDPTAVPEVAEAETPAAEATPEPDGTALPVPPLPADAAHLHGNCAGRPLSGH